MSAFGLWSRRATSRTFVLKFSAGLGHIFIDHDVILKTRNANPYSAPPSPFVAVRRWLQPLSGGSSEDARTRRDPHW